MSTEIVPTAAVSGQENPPPACRSGTKNGEDFAVLLEGILFSGQRSPSSLPENEQGNGPQEKEIQNFSPEQQFTLALETILGLSAPQEMVPQEEGFQLPEQAPGDSGAQWLPEIDPGEAVQPAEERAGKGGELQLAAEITGAGLNMPEEGFPVEAVVPEGEHAGQDMIVVAQGKTARNEQSSPLAAAQGEILADAQNDNSGSAQGEILIPAESSPGLPAKSRSSFLAPATQPPEAGKQEQQESGGVEKQPFYGRAPEGGRQEEVTPQARAPSFTHSQGEKPLQELNPVMTEELPELPGEKVAVLTESDPRHTPRASFPESKERESAVSAMVSSGKEQEKQMTAGQENRYPAFSGGEGEAVFSQGGSTKAAQATRGPFNSAPQLPADPQPYSREIMEQIAERIDYLARPGEQELRLKLQPEFLGEVLIRVRRMKGILSGEIITQHLAVKELLEGQMETLRQRFQEVNLDVERFQVFVRDEGRQGFAFAKGHRGGALSSFAGSPPGDAVAGETGDLYLELWEGKRRVDYLV